MCLWLENKQADEYPLITLTAAAVSVRKFRRVYFISQRNVTKNEATRFKRDIIYGKKLLEEYLLKPLIEVLFQILWNFSDCTVLLYVVQLRPVDSTLN